MSPKGLISVNIKIYEKQIPIRFSIITGSN